jgi:hypothetical protein
MTYLAVAVAAAETTGPPGAVFVFAGGPTDKGEARVRTNATRFERLTECIHARLALAIFPGCAAPVLGAWVLALTLSPWNALAAWALSWLAFHFALPRLSALRQGRTWSWLACPVCAVNTWPVRWLLVADGVALAVRHGATVVPAVAIPAGWLALDAWQTWKRWRSTRQRS